MFGVAGAQELRNRRVAQEHIDAALAAVFGDSKQIAGREPTDDQQAGAQLVGVDQAGSRVSFGVLQSSGLVAGPRLLHGLAAFAGMWVEGAVQLLGTHQ